MKRRSRGLPRIVIDPGGLDALGPGCGQYRYVSDLLRGLAGLRAPAVFVVLGSRFSPPAELAPVFADPAWIYRFMPRPAGRICWAWEQIWLTTALSRMGADMCHSLHTVLPILAPCPVVGTVLDLMYEIFPEYASAARSRPYRLFRWAAQHRARRLVCISTTTASDVLRRWQVPTERLAVIPMGTAFGGGELVPIPSVLPTCSVVLSAYNLEPRKNLMTLVTAFAAVRREVPDAVLVLFGRSAVTPDRERAFNAHLAALGVTGAVVRTGLLTDPELEWLYRRAAVFAFPSLYEGFGYPVLEAMAAGTCVIARAASSTAEVVGNAGVLIETADPAATSTTLVRLLRDPSGRARVGAQAAARAETFTVRRMAEQTWAVYEAALR